MKDHVQYQRVAELPGLVLGSARFEKFSFDRHFHIDYHIGLVTDGVQRQTFSGKSVLLGPGCISLMPPGEIHDGINEGDAAYTLRTFRLSHDLLARITEEIAGKRGDFELGGTMLEDPMLAAQLLRLHDAMGSRDDSLAMAVQSQWLTLLELLLSRSRGVAPSEETGALSPMQWHRVRDYCFAHLGEKISLDELAAVCGLGRFHFLRQFKQTIGMTPHAWLVRLRLEQACSLLARSAGTIADVAQGLGFYDQSHFNRAFRQAFGVAPSNY
ncbi:AraC family transcriptional regulator [Paraburkholderia sp. Tr-20389]|uniref:AraC family transcriptional regulator n=1 Tax=Paraburkholderia sp. Tr-20389 TaxID=2703903 RepID=UPI00197EAC13|nr:AraC family transcriptional regulator [Paraburkholderia sp. Tr-20389]MBN3754363.1 AraC family transcriptional regulator [Paraburkholderia sp. Tr-20389]